MTNIIKMNYVKKTLIEIHISKFLDTKLTFILRRYQFSNRYLFKNEKLHVGLLLNRKLA